MSIETSTLRPLAAAVLACLLGACAVGPDFVRPETPVAERFANADASAPLATTAGDAEFWRTLGDPELDALIERTLAANQDLRAALARYDAAQALSRGSRYDRYPTVTAHAGASAARLSADQAPESTRGQRDDVRSYDVGVSLGWELDFFGRVRREIESRDADAQALAEDLRTLKVAIAAEVARTYVGLRGFQEQLDVARRNAGTQAETLHLVDTGLAAGRGTEFDTARARAQLETTSARIPSLEAEIAVARHRLAVLAGEQPGTIDAELEAARSLPALPPTIDPGTPGELLRRRPDIAVAEARLHAATARVGVATADLYPRFTLSGLLGTQAAERTALFGADSESGFVALGVDWSFLDTGRVRARIAASDALSEERLAQYRQTVLRALEETENALVRYGKARIEDEHLARAADDGTRAAGLARTRYEAGAGTLLEVLDAERVQLQAQDALAGGRTRTLAGLIDVYRAVAGGWPARAPLAANSPGSR